MLIRFLSIATMSVTLLTIQAINSTETKSSLPENTIQSEEESIFSDQATFQKLYLKKEETDYDLSQKIKTPRIIKTNFNKKDQPTIVIASIGPIPISLPEIAVKERPSYLPPIDYIADKEEKAAILTANLKTKNQTVDQNNQFETTVHFEKQPAILKKKRTKKVKRKYAKTKKYRKVKYSLGKKIRKAKRKRKRYNRHYKPANYMSAFGLN